jgi:hypothetical protein
VRSPRVFDDDAGTYTETARRPDGEVTYSVTEKGVILARLGSVR